MRWFTGRSRTLVLTLALIALGLTIIIVARSHPAPSLPSLTAGPAEREPIALAVVRRFGIGAANPQAHMVQQNSMTVGRSVVDGSPAVKSASLQTDEQELPPPPPLVRSSQLIRTAALSLEVSDIDRAVRAASAVVQGELGDVINLDARSDGDNGIAHSATLEVRVPQYRFDRALDELAALGKVRDRSINAQDVAGQIVDAQSRLRNLRHTEADLLKIMDRYGDIDQVLRVTQEISSVREQIETLDGQLKGMQYQVAYSTISITFVTPPPVAQPPSSTHILADAWKQAASAVRSFTLAIAGIGLWLVAFSPYLVLGAVLLVVAVRRVQMRSVARSS